MKFIQQVLSCTNVNFATCTLDIIIINDDIHFARISSNETDPSSLTADFTCVFIIPSLTLA